MMKLKQKNNNNMKNKFKKNLNFKIKSIFKVFEIIKNV